MMKKVITILVTLMLVCTLLLGISYSDASAFSKTPFSRTNIPAQMRVTASALNVRSGPSTYFQRVGMVYQDQIVDCIGRLGDWYIIHLDSDILGVASGRYLTPYYPPQAQPAPAPTLDPQADTIAEEVRDEAEKMLELVNAERAKVGAPALTLDSEVMRVAQFKAQDMVDRNYFSHNSPTYGSPFDMLKSFGVSYRTAGENLAGNISVERAHTSLMNSEGHRRNILNANYNRVGIGIVDSPKYGKIYVQMFIGR